jgi:cytosine/adenosine deaminase-related metal-dependent hydrolase
VLDGSFGRPGHEEERNVSKRVLIRGGHVLTMDPKLGDLHYGDVLIEDDRIVEVGFDIEAGDCEVIDAGNGIVIPGFIDTHRHTWETIIRGIAPDVTLAGYFDIVLDLIAPAYRAEDVYAGNLLGSLEAIDAGVTTLLDWSHINNTPEHADAAISGLREAALRSVYCYGTPNTSLADWWFDSTLKAPDDIRRVRDQYFNSDNGLMTLAMGARGPGFCGDDIVRHDWGLAREIGVPISVHVGMGPIAGRFAAVDQLNRMGLLGDDTTYIHCNYLSEGEIKLIAETGGKTSISPTVELMMGHGIPPTGALMAQGIRPSLSVDVTTTVAGDMFTQMKFLLATERALVLARAWHAETEEEPELLCARDVLEFATIDGARVCDLDDRTGSLTPGKQADVVVLRFDHTNAWPLMDPVSTAVLQADTRNVDMVMVAGKVLKRDGQLVGADLGRARDLAEQSLEYLLERCQERPEWAAWVHSSPRHRSVCGHAH